MIYIIIFTFILVGIIFSIYGVGCAYNNLKYESPLKIRKMKRKGHSCSNCKYCDLDRYCPSCYCPIYKYDPIKGQIVDDNIGESCETRIKFNLKNCHWEKRNDSNEMD